VVDVGGRHGELGGGEQGCRTRGEEARFADHEVIVEERIALKVAGRRSVQALRFCVVRGGR
jgi:hypothetical protein